MNETTPRDRMSKITKLLIPVSWTLWGILLLLILWAFVDSIANPVYTPEVSPQVGPMVMGALLIVFVGFGFLLRWAARRRSGGCLIALTLMLAYLFFMLIAILVFEAWNDWQIEREISRFDERSLPMGATWVRWVPPTEL
jgi:hypothetical protein